MRHLPHRRMLMRACVVAALTAVAGLLALVPAGVAAAAPSPKPGHQHQHHDHDHDHEKRTKPGTHQAGPQHAGGRRATPSSPSPTPSAVPSPTAAALGPTLPFRVAPPSPRRLSGQTVGALSYDASALPRQFAGRTGTPTGPTGALRAAPASTSPRHGRGDWPVVATSVRSAVDQPTAPLLVGALIAVFVLVQHRIDRKDPKLSAGHYRDGADLRFGPPRRGSTPP